HAVLQEDFGLQHQVFQHRGLGIGRGVLGLLLRRPRLHHRSKAVGDAVELVGINFAAQPLQPLLVPRLVGINFGGAVQRVARQRALAAADTGTKGKVITLFGCKGGRGTTVIALNLAVALARGGEGRVVAVDLDLQGGDLTLFLSLKPSYTIHDAVANMDRVDALFLKSLLCDHPTGVSLLAAPHRIEEADRLLPLRISQLLSLLRASFAYVVVDTSPTYDERTFAALDAADGLLLVTAPDYSSLYHTRRCLELFERLTYTPAKVKILLNRCPPPAAKAAKMAQEILKRPVLWEFPEDGAVTASLIAGEPLVRRGKNSPLAARFEALAQQLDGKKGSNPKRPQASRGFRTLLRAGALHLLQSRRKEG
ncbi:MAG: AAA family ATPase, partial [candidate division NC10 bacterium]|nr:AAA family ATPase [candidate division NC10 bacterium]